MRDYPKSLWSYNPIPNGCVLNLPLWGLRGSTFKSIDRYGHLCTVSGAVWVSKGRYFDGTDDYLKNTTADWRVNDTAGTIIIWFKCGTTGVDQAFFGSADEGTSAYYIWFGIRSTNKLVVFQYKNDTADDIRGGTTVTDDAWHMASIVSSGTAYTIYLDVTAESLTVSGGANNGDWFFDTTNRDNFSVGNVIRSYNANHYKGYIGDVILYDRALTTYEISHIYRATKGRYL